MIFAGLDLNATRARAVSGPAGLAAHALALDGNRRDLPMLLSLEGRSLDVGRAGLALCRQTPHLVCDNFLSRLGTPHEWNAGRHRLDSARALAAVFERLRSACSSAKGMVLAAPAYLTRQQLDLLGALAGKGKLPFLGSVPAPLAAALSAYKAGPWMGLAVVVDADDHALTLSLLATARGENIAGGAPEAKATNTFTLLHTQSVTLPRLGLLAWKLRLIDGLADRCVRHSRRDPRDSGAAEQMLFEQLEEVFDRSRQEQPVEVVVRGGQWCQNLILRPEDVRACCAPLVQMALEKFREALASVESEGVGKILVSASAWRLPGLREALQDEAGEESSLVPLSADSAALGAHELAAFFQRGDLPHEHLDAVVRYPLAAAAAPKAPEKKRRIFRF